MNPYTYLLGGLIGATASDVEIKCSSREITTFSPPSGETCLSYAGAFVEKMGGYLLNGDSTGDCQYCPMSNSNAFLDQKHIFYSTGWPWGYFGIFTLFAISSFALAYLFFYITKVNPPNSKLFKKLSLI